MGINVSFILGDAVNHTFCMPCNRIRSISPPFSATTIVLRLVSLAAIGIHWQTPDLLKMRYAVEYDLESIN
jgi:hypothetical protein